MTQEEPASVDLEMTLRMMDVADELRRTRQRVEEHLDEGDRERIREQLLRRYEEMGHAADPDLLDEAIDTVLAQRNRFRPPEPGFGLKLAGLWIERRRIARWVGLPLLGLLGMAGVVALASVGLDSLEARRETSRQGTIAQLSGRAETLAQQVRQLAREPEVVALAERHRADARRGRENDELERIERATTELAALVARLEREYTLVIVRGRERDGVRHYLIVQALGSDRRPLRLEIRDEETGAVEQVTEWGERVAKETYDRVARDYADNKVIDDNVFGHKRSGFLEPEKRYQSLGQITRW